MSDLGPQDELAIRDLVARVARLADSDDVEAYVALFTDDASWEMPGAERRGHADIRAGAEERRAAGVVGPGTHSRHVVGTVVVDLDGDRATAASTWQFYVDTATAPRLVLMGTYDDTFARTPDGWRLARRVITIG
ncbi:MAG: nuclear transport factor 2 family protein [Microthrixaceae bacterium]